MHSAALRCGRPQKRKPSNPHTYPVFMRLVFPSICSPLFSKSVLLLGSHGVSKRMHRNMHTESLTGQPEQPNGIESYRITSNTVRIKAESNRIRIESNQRESKSIRIESNQINSSQHESHQIESNQSELRTLSKHVGSIESNRINSNRT